MAQIEDSWPPTEGFYTHKIVRGGHVLPIRIWFGVPYDPVSGERMDRAPRWQAIASSRDIDIHRVWPFCQETPIDFETYSKMLLEQQAQPDVDFFKPIDLLKTKITF